jgi:diacylglycerol kinase
MINLKTFYYAFKGVIDLFSGRHPNAIVHLAAVFAVSVSGFIFNISAIEWCIVVLCFIAVISLEAINSAIEYIVDLISPEHHPLAGKAKDIAAAAVLIAAVGSVLIATIIFLPKFF